MATAQRRQYIDIVPILTAIDCLFHQPCAFLRQHRTAELTELIAQLGLGKRLVKIAPVAVAGVGRATAIGENHGHSCWSKPRCHRAHSRILGDRDTVTERHDRLVMHRCIVERCVSRVSPHHHGGSRMWQRIF